MIWWIREIISTTLYGTVFHFPPTTPTYDYQLRIDSFSVVEFFSGAHIAAHANYSWGAASLYIGSWGQKFMYISVINKTQHTATENERSLRIFRHFYTKNISVSSAVSFGRSSGNRAAVPSDMDAIEEDSEN